MLPTSSLWPRSSAAADPGQPHPPGRASGRCGVGAGSVGLDPVWRRGGGWLGPAGWWPAREEPVGCFTGGSGRADWAAGSRDPAAMTASLEIRLLGPFKVLAVVAPRRSPAPRHALLALALPGAVAWSRSRCWSTPCGAGPVAPRNAACSSTFRGSGPRWEPSRSLPPRTVCAGGCHRGRLAVRGAAGQDAQRRAGR